MAAVAAEGHFRDFDFSSWASNDDIGDTMDMHALVDVDADTAPSETEIDIPYDGPPHNVYTDLRDDAFVSMTRRSP